MGHSRRPRFYDVVYRHLDYGGTADLVESLIRERNPGAASLLDMSCGTGLHLQQWVGRFDEVEGADVDPAMLEVAREHLGDRVPLHVADYTEFDLGRTYDAVTCMFSSIGYAHTPDRLDAAIASMGRHLNPGGVLVVEPWLLPHMVQPPFIRTHVAEADDMVALRSTRHLAPGDTSVTDMEFAYLVTTADGSKVLTERHVMGLFTADRYVEAFASAGLDAEFLEGATELNRGLVIGVNR